MGIRRFPLWTVSVVFAERARHFVMLDDTDSLHATLDAFLARTASAKERR